VIELCDRVALVFEFALMGQRSELVALELHDLTETPDGLEVLIHASKTGTPTVPSSPFPRGQHGDTDSVRLVRAACAAATGPVLLRYRRS